MIALDLESVLVPEIWESVARATGISALARTTRDDGDYNALMRQRIQLCRQHRLTLVDLQKLVGLIEPLPGAVEFLRWAQLKASVVIVSDSLDRKSTRLNSSH